MASARFARTEFVTCWPSGRTARPGAKHPKPLDAWWVKVTEGRPWEWGFIGFHGNVNGFYSNIYIYIYIQ